MHPAATARSWLFAKRVQGMKGNERGLAFAFHSVYAACMGSVLASCYLTAGTLLAA
jgi:hypothetical protein